MSHVFFRPTDTVGIQVDALRGEMVAVGGEHPILGDANTFHLKVRSAALHVSTASLSAVMNEHVFAAPDAPIKDVKISVRDGKLILQGELQKAGLSIPFELDGVPSVNVDGRVRLHPVAIRTLGIPVKGLADRTGIKIDDVITLAKGTGLEADGKDMLLDPSKAIPPPVIEGPVSLVQVEAAGLYLEIGVADGISPASEEMLRPPTAAKNWIFLRHSTITIGRLTMRDTLMEIMGNEIGERVDFHQQRFEKEQLPKGHEVVMENGGLLVYVPEYAHLGAQRVGLAPL